MAPELVTLDCSLTYVLHVPNAHPYQLRVGWTGVICQVVTPHRQDHAWSSPIAKLEN